MNPWVDIFFRAMQTGLLAYAIFSGKPIVFQLGEKRERPETMQAVPGFGGMPDYHLGHPMNPWVSMPNNRTPGP